MINRTFAFLLFLKKDKVQPNNTVPVYIRITIDGQRADISTKRYVNPGLWNAKTQKVDGKSEEIRSLNTYFKTLEHEVFEAHRQLISEGKLITAETLKNRINGVDEKPRMLQQIITNHNNDVKALIGNGYTKATWVKYNTTQKHITSFLKWKYNILDIDIREVNYEFLSDFEFYLKAQKKIAHNTTAKYVKNTKKVINECIAKGWLNTNVFGSYKITPIIVDRVFLTEDELELLKNKEFNIARIAQVRDIFVFCCYTGFSFIDVAQLTPLKIGIGIDREKWIFTNRQKNNIPSNIPLLPQALDIIAKYKDHAAVLNKGTLLPVLSNQKMNAYLKEIADLCGIAKNLTFHCARHTFATTVTLCNDVPIESVSKMLGHKKIQTTQHYAKILDKKVSNDMNTLRQKLKPSMEVIKSEKEAAG